MLTLQTPYPQFFDKAGKPLDAGYVYIGTAGANPQTSSITVYWDQALTQPAAQPLRTAAGYIARNGTPARVFVNADDYSILVQTSTGVQVAYEQNASRSGVTPIALGGTGATDAAGARTALGAASLGANTFTGAQTLPGNASNALEAVPKQQLDAMPGRNRVINGTFNINQRAVSGTVTLASGVYGHDRWKAGSGGATYTFSGETITIVLGTLVQVIEGVNVPEGGNYVLSWTGTAQARVDGASYAASPIAVTGKTAGANTTIEFSTGTVTQVQYEAGTSKGGFDRRQYGHELMLAQRYCRTLYANMVTSGFVQDYQFATMRGTPNVTFLSGITFTGGLLVGTSASSVRQSTYSSVSGDGTALLTSEL